MSFWPEWRFHHASVCVNSELMIAGGSRGFDGDNYTITNCSISNTITIDGTPHITWNEVYAMNVIVFLFRFKHFSAIPS